MFNKDYIINVQKSEERVKSLLLDNKYFTCNLSENQFFLTENLFFSNKFMHPIAICKLSCLQKDTITVNLHLKLQPVDKHLSLIRFLVIILIAVFSVVSTHSFEIAVIVACFSLICELIFLLAYKFHCRRIYKKIVALLK